MKFVDLVTQQRKIRSEIDARIAKVLDHGQYIMGPEIEALEDRFKSYVGVEHAISCSSGTDALLMTLMAQDVKPGDIIFTTPFTFIATAEAIALMGAIPIFVDIDPVTFNIDPDKLTLAIKALKSRDSSIYPLPACVTEGEETLSPRGIVTVDLFGLPAEYSRIHKIAEENQLFVIGDAAQSFGAEYHGKKSCSLAEMSCTSFFPAKPLGCYGDGGMCFTNDEKFARIMRSVRIHGQGQHQYDNVRIGINGRMDTIQAAILLAKFSIFPEEVSMRQVVANRYNDMLKECEFLETPKVPEGCVSAWAQYSLLAKDESSRAALRNRLQGKGIPTAIYYPNPLHLQEAFSYLLYKEEDFPVSVDYSARIFSLPMHPYLTEKEQGNICEILNVK